jgi:hypothetical protein
MNFCFLPDRSHPRPSVPARASSWPLPIAPGTADRWLGPCSPVTETAAPPVAQLPTRRPTQGRRGKKVHGGNDLAVVLQKGQPVPLRIPRVLVGRNDGRRRGCRFLLINPLRVNSRALDFPGTRGGFSFGDRPQTITLLPTAPSTFPGTQLLRSVNFGESIPCPPVDRRGVGQNNLSPDEQFAGA